VDEDREGVPVLALVKDDVSVLELDDGELESDVDVVEDECDERDDSVFDDVDVEDDEADESDDVVDVDVVDVVDVDVVDVDVVDVEADESDDDESDDDEMDEVEGEFDDDESDDDENDPDDVDKVLCDENDVNVFELTEDDEVSEAGMCYPLPNDVSGVSKRPVRVIRVFTLSHRGKVVIVFSRINRYLCVRQRQCLSQALLQLRHCAVVYL